MEAISSNKTKEIKEMKIQQKIITIEQKKDFQNPNKTKNLIRINKNI